MNLDWLDAVVALIAGLLGFHGSRLLSRTQAQNLQTQTITSLMEQVNKLVADRAQDREELEALRDRIDKDDDFKEVIKKYFAELVEYFKEKGITDYPKPPDVLDTNPKIKAVKKK